jgi:hypothetical protein
VGIEFRTLFDEASADASVPEDSTLAKLAIYIGNDCLTRNRARRRGRLLQPRDFVYGPVAGLAEWFIENWMAILWETHTPFEKSSSGDNEGDYVPLPGAREAFQYWNNYINTEDNIESNGSFWVSGHFPDHKDDPGDSALSEEELACIADWQHRHLMGHASSDLAIPSIVMVPEGRRIVLAVDGLPGGQGASVEFLNSDRKPRTKPTLQVLDKADFREQVQSFVDETIERAALSSGHPRWVHWLNDRWKTAQREEAQPKKQLECMLGVTATRRLDELMVSDRPGLVRGLERLLLDCPLVKSKHELRPAEDMVDEFAVKGEGSLSSKELAGWEHLGQRPIPMDVPDYEQGYHLARYVRSVLDLGDSPIRNLGAFLKRMDVVLQDYRDTSLFRAAVFAPRRRTAHIVPSSRSERMRSHLPARFAVASALGRLLWESRSEGNTPICAAQGGHAMISQSRRANSFAAELILPATVVRGVDPHSPELATIAETYQISHRAAKLHTRDVQNYYFRI